MNRVIFRTDTGYCVFYFDNYHQVSTNCFKFINLNLAATILLTLTDIITIDSGRTFKRIRRI